MSLRAAILGFLELEPTTGYSLKQRFEGSVASFWSATQSQIYRELHALERDGLVHVRHERGLDGKPDRKVYATTAEGRSVLDAWLHEPLEPMQLRHPLLLKFVFASKVPPPALDAILEEYHRGVSTILAEYRERLQSKEIFALARSTREADIWRLSIEHGIAWCELEAAWVTKARRRLRPGRSAKPTGKKARRQTS